MTTHAAETADSEPPLELSVVIPTYNRAASLERLITSLYTDQGAPATAYEVVVAVDGSTDDTIQRLEVLAATHPTLRWYTQPNRGGNAARNLGWRHARGSTVAFLDDDEIAPPGWVARVLERLRARPDLDGMGGPCIEGRHHLHLCDRCAESLRHERRGAAEQTCWLPGGNMILRRRALATVGGFHEGLISYQEPEWFRRAEKNGLVFAWFEDLAIVHAKDLLSRRELISREWRRGWGRPITLTIGGSSALDLSRTIRSLLRSTGHILRRRCEGGILFSAREAGALAGSLFGPAGYLRAARRQRMAATDETP